MFSLFEHTRIDERSQALGLASSQDEAQIEDKTGHNARKGHGSSTLCAQQRIANSDMINRASDARSEAKTWPWPMDGNVLHALHETRRVTHTCYDLANIRRARAQHLLRAGWTTYASA